MSTYLVTYYTGYRSDTARVEGLSAAVSLADLTARACGEASIAFADPRKVGPGFRIYKNGPPVMIVYGPRSGTRFYRDDQGYIVGARMSSDPEAYLVYSGLPNEFAARYPRIAATWARVEATLDYLAGVRA